MFFTRKLGNLIRGQTTPFQIYSACLLGSLIAFSPGFRQAPGLTFLLVALLVILNANLFVAAAVGLLAKLLYFLLLPLLFDLGVWLVEGPLHGPLAVLANAPVTAWFGFEYYVVTAGIPVAIAFGLLAGFLIHHQVRNIRRRLTRWEHDSDKYRTWSSKKWVKVFAFVFIGGTKPAKGDWSSLSPKAIGNPIRPLGAVLVLLVVVLAFIALQFFDGLILKEATRTALERANGATVDIEDVQFHAGEGQLVITGLAMADANALNENLFEAETLAGDVSGMSLLRRKVALDRLEISEAEMGTERRSPGKHVGSAPKPAEEPDEAEDPDTYSIEEILANASQWKERLARISEWIKSMSPDEKPEDVPDAEEAPRTWRERLEERARREGYAEIASDQLIRQSPRFAIYEIIANGVKISQLPGERVDFRGEHISTQPWLLESIPVFSAQAQSGTFGLHFEGISYTTSEDANRLSYFYRDLPAAQLAELLKDPGQFPVTEGTFSIEGTGSQQGVTIDLPLNVTLRNAQIAIASLDPIEVESMEIPAAIGGKLSAPTLTVDPSAFQNALKGAAQGRLKDEAEQRLEKALGGETSDRLRKLFGGGAD